MAEARLRRGDLLPRMMTPPPGPRSRELSSQLEEFEAPGINTLYGGRPNILWQEARGAYEQSLAKRPNNGHALFGIARSYQLAGADPLAKAAFQRFLEAWRRADRDLPQVRHAEDWLAEH